MGCCGEPARKDDQYTNRPLPYNPGVIQQQPAPHQGLQMPPSGNPTAQPLVSTRHGNLSPSCSLPFLKFCPLGCCSKSTIEDDEDTDRPMQPLNTGIVQQQLQTHEKRGTPPPPPSFQTHQHPALPMHPPFVPPYDASGQLKTMMTNQVGMWTPLYQPNPVYAPPRLPPTSPSLTGPMLHTVTSVPKSKANKALDEGRMSISVDFGTTFSGVAYTSSCVASGVIQQILQWPGSSETFRKVPTCLLYDEHGQVLAWGIEAKNANPMPGTIRCEWFKLFLEPHALHGDSAVDLRLPQLPPGKTAMNLIVDFLTCLWEYAKEEITREIGVVADLNSADVVVTCPAAWDNEGCDLMRAAAIEAGLVQSTHAGDIHWRDRLRIITESEAVAMHCMRLTDFHKLCPSQNVMICDAGGGTVDLACYKVTGQVGQNANLEIAEICARSANCGSLFLDLQFRGLIQTLLADHPVHHDAASLAYFMHSFSQADKLAFRGETDDEIYFHFTCFNVQDQHDPSVGLINGELAIPGILIRQKVFDPVIDQVLEMVEEQSRKIDRKIDALLLVGGFAGSEYLLRKVEDKFSGEIKVIVRPSDAGAATVRGAAQYGLSRKTIVSTMIVPRAYIMKVKLPAEHEDWLKRPAYIKENNSGVAICENRLQYLAMKGAILRKGQRMKAKFCKFSQSSQDCDFTAVLCTSNSDKIMRYTDEGELTELCKWTANLSSLPSFQQNMSVPRPHGFYTEFEVGFEVSGAEMQGVLICEGVDWSQIKLDFLNHHLVASKVE